MLVRVPYEDMNRLEEVINKQIKNWGPIHGLIAPYSTTIAFNLRCAARFQDRFPDQKIYAVVPGEKNFDTIKTIFRAGFSNIVIPLYLGGVQYDHYFQFIQNEDLDKMTLHVAGGKFDSELWNRDNWSWSKEGL